MYIPPYIHHNNNFILSDFNMLFYFKFHIYIETLSVKYRLLSIITMHSINDIIIFIILFISFVEFDLLFFVVPKLFGTRHENMFEIFSTHFATN